MSALEPAQRTRVEAAVKAAEARSSAEFVCAVARAADTYFTVPLLIAVAVALALPFLLDAFEPDWTAGPGAASWRELAPPLIFVVLALALTRPAIATRLTPAAVKARRAGRMARAAFLETGLAGVERRNGVLLFVALAERHVEVIADAGVHAKVDAGAWQAVVDAFTAAVRRGDVADGFAAALERLGAILEAAYPRGGDDANEIADRLVELD